jgi:hypothetical protein
MVTTRRKTTRPEDSMEKMKLTSNQKAMLKRRGMNPDHYVVVKDLFSALWVKNIYTGAVKILNKHN